MYGKAEGRGRDDLASMEYRNSPIVSFRKMTEHWRSPTEKGKKSTSTSPEVLASRYTDPKGLKKALSLGVSSEEQK